MRELFDELKRDGAAGIERIIRERRQEGVDLDFTSKARPAEPGLDKSDNEKLAICISAFANSAGGLLVWGVDARKDADGVDCATQAVPIANIERFESDVAAAATSAVMPRHAGVHLARVNATTGDGSGYLLVFVERSERRPHRCEVAPRFYYKRIGARSMQMEHYDIEDAFNRAAVAELRVSAAVRFGSVDRDGGSLSAQVYVSLWLHNDSSVSARFPYVHFETKNVGASNYEGGASQVIHPGNKSHIAEIVLRGTAWMSPEGEIRPVDRDRIEVPSTTISCRFGCLNSRQRWAGFRVFGKRELEVLRPPSNVDSE